MFPPPAAGTDIFPQFHCPGAGSAADAGITLLVEPIVRNIVFGDVVPYIVLAPIYQWIDFDDVAVIFVQFDPTDSRPRHRLLAPKSSHPSVEIFQSTVEWLHLPNAAAQFAQLY
jgi:hypothetical protein